jgi:endonuclease/exonuclease/phosphatase family metal-dependent hydrolase
MTTRDTPEVPGFRIVTYNVHRCRGIDGRVIPARIVEVLREIDADIVALQEVLSSPSTSSQADQAGFIARHLGMAYRIGHNKLVGNNLFGNVVLSRLPIIYSRNLDVSCHGRECRGCLRTDVQLSPGVVVHVFNAHLGTSLRERRKQANILLSEDILGHGEISGPRVLLGDFNDWELRLRARLSASKLVSADVRAHNGKPRSYPSIFPLFHLDHIYYDSDLHLHSIRVVRNKLARVASDHLPMFADLRLRHLKTNRQKHAAVESHL